MAISIVKYTAVATSIMLVVIALRFIPYNVSLRQYIPLTPEAFERLDVNNLSEPPSKEFELSAGADQEPSGAGFFRKIFRGIGVGRLTEAPVTNETAFPDDEGGGSLSDKLFGGSGKESLSGAPSKEDDTLTGGSGVKPLPVPDVKPIAVGDIVTPRPVFQSTPEVQEVGKVIEKIIERVIIVKEPVYIPSPSTAPAPVSKSAPSSAPAIAASESRSCSVQAFDNAAGSLSHTLLFQCEGFNQCSIARSGSTFVDVSGKGYFNFPGPAPTNYKIRCDDRSRVWSANSSIVSKPTYSQIGYRWFANENADLPGESLADINREALFDDLPGNQAARLRLVINAGRAGVVRGDVKFKLQYALFSPLVAVQSPNWNTGTMCNQLPDGEFKDITTGANVSFYDNSEVIDRSLMAVSIDDPFYGSAVPQTNQESGSFSNINAAIPQDTPAIWDFALKFKETTTNQLFCFRVIRSDGSPLDSYESWPAMYKK